MIDAQTKSLIEKMRETANSFVTTHSQAQFAQLRFLANRMRNVRDELDLMLNEIDNYEVNRPANRGKQ